MRAKVTLTMTTRDGSTINGQPSADMIEPDLVALVATTARYEDAEGPTADDVDLTDLLFMFDDVRVTDVEFER